MQFMPILSLLFYEITKLLINNGTMTAAIYWRQLYIDGYILMLYIIVTLISTNNTELCAAVTTHSFAFRKIK